MDSEQEQIGTLAGKVLGGRAGETPHIGRHRAVLVPPEEESCTQGRMLEK